MSTVRAISLFSGGLDSICATRLVMEQGIEVIALKFVSPFFGYEALLDQETYCREAKDKYGINVRIIDISEDYLEMLRNPPHGFGKYFNPCIDCKIFMLQRAKELLVEYDASFLITGEVLGQRPMSQRRDTLNVIERDSGSRSILLRPLSAKLMKETEAEVRGLVDREKLLDFSGRGRSRQIALARSYGITDFPAPAGGCILADPILSRRIQRAYNGTFVLKLVDINVHDILLMLVGRQYLFPGGGWFILGRDEKENLRIDELIESGDIRFGIEERPGPVAILRHTKKLYPSAETLKIDILHAARLVARYAKKIEGLPAPGRVLVQDGNNQYEIEAAPLADDLFRDWVI
ncbi:MAG: thiamine biosynthesis protein [Desulfobulbaceae bacterium]|nr:MAG: thiamine biosynthesis protein [Desulfobulbaceae bacterium]